MKWHLLWTNSEYNSLTHNKFKTEQELVDFINKYAEARYFQFTVIEGFEVEFEPVKTVLQYKRKQ